MLGTHIHWLQSQLIFAQQMYYLAQYRQMCISSKINLIFNLARDIHIAYRGAKGKKIMFSFIGRKAERKKLEALSKIAKSTLVVLKGRRRIGKSRLASEFGKDKALLSFAGLAPIKGMNAQDQRNAFASDMAEQCKMPPFTFLDWSDGFSHLSQYIKINDGKLTVILLDEISWMASKDPTFIPKLKSWWDKIVLQPVHIMLILCGSVSTWIEKNIINSTAFFGRISLQLTLQELSLPESYQLLQDLGFRPSHYDVFKILSVTGGIPWYLEQINPAETADENIKRLCFEKDSLFSLEFDRIFHDLFSKKNEIYKKIINILSDGMRDLREIRTSLRYAKSGSLSKHLDQLIASGFVSKHQDWSLQTGKLKRKALYRLCDNYLRFYLKYIEPNLPKIKQNSYLELSLSALPAWEVMMGFQVENLILKNRSLLLHALGIPAHDIVADNPYIQYPTARQKGCQIDYLIQTHSNNLFVCEFKFQKRALKLDIIESMQDKMLRFAVPRGFGICPVLVHVGGVSDSIYEKRYFYRIIDLTDFFMNDFKSDALEIPYK